MSKGNTAKKVIFQDDTVQSNRNADHEANVDTARFGENSTEE